ncbi:MAG: hypothetical protein Q7J16_01555 [Candidatus Cloacimonadales bacterium]|nr:hypothetical protein [Candidatus Cloacimonadales bacterium]
MIIFLYLVLFFIAMMLLFTFLIASFLKQNGVKVDVLWMRFKFFYYLHQYQKITKLETGKTGPYFSLWIISVVGLIATLVVSSYMK